MLRGREGSPSPDQSQDTTDGREDSGQTREQRGRTREEWNLLDNEELFSHPELADIAKEGQDLDLWALEDLIRDRIEHFKSRVNEYQELTRLLETSVLARIDRLQKLEVYEAMRAESPRWQEIIDLLHHRFFADTDSARVESMLIPLMVRVNTEISEQVSSRFREHEGLDALRFLAKERLLTTIQRNLKLLPPTINHGRRRKGLTFIIQRAIGVRTATNELRDVVAGFLDQHESSLVAEAGTLKATSDQIAPESVEAAIAETEEVARREPSRFTEGLQHFFRQAVTSRTARIVVATLVASSIASSIVLRYGPGVARGIQSKIQEIQTQHNRPITAESVYQELRGPITEAANYERGQLIEDETIVRPNAIVHTSDLLYRASLLGKELFANNQTPDQETLKKYRNTMRLLLGAKQLWPQAVKFKFVENWGKLRIEPLDWQEETEVSEQLQATVTIVGSEIESLVAAIRAAKQGQAVILLHQVGELGNLNSDTGANLACFDSVRSSNVAPPEELLEIFRVGLAMAPDNIVSIPNDQLHEKLTAFLQTRYPTIRLVPTRTLNALHVNRFTGSSDNKNARRFQLVTEEGAQIDTQHLLDTTPECIVGEKLNIGQTPETFNLAYGMVFDLNGLSRRELSGLKEVSQVHPDRILAALGIDRRTIDSIPPLRQQYQVCISALRTPTHEQGHCAWGYQGLARAFQFYAKLIEYYGKPQQRQQLTYLNRVRIVDGFNVAIHEGERATFNSISYRWPKRIYQGDHSLSRDPEFALLRNVEAPLLENFMRLVTGDIAMALKLPEELYVRQQSSQFFTLAPRRLIEMGTKPIGPAENSFFYPFDLRGVTARDQWDNLGTVLGRVQRYAKNKRLYSAASPRHAITEIPGLYLINKNALAPETFGATRLQQCLALDARSTVDAISQQTIESLATNLRRSHPSIAKKYNPLQPLMVQLQRRTRVV